MEKEEIEREVRRQVFHAVLGLVLLAIVFYLGRRYVVGFLGFVLLGGSLIINWRVLGSKMPLVQWFEEKFERDATRFPGYGSAWYVVGALMLAVFLKDPGQIAAGVVMLALGDAVSTLVGILGTHKLPYNEHKTVEGTIAFFFASLLACLFVGLPAVPLAFLAAVAEGLPLPYDDNIVVPAVCVLFFSII
jgi:dolichol kinase